MELTRREAYLLLLTEEAFAKGRLNRECPDLHGAGIGPWPRVPEPHHVHGTGEGLGLFVESHGGLSGITRPVRLPEKDA